MRTAVLLLLAAASVPAGAADLSASYTAGLFATSNGRGPSGADLVHHLDLVLASDRPLPGWRGGRAQLHLIANWGGRPNDRAGTLQGVDNQEVGTSGLRLLEAWIEQDLGPAASLRAGVTDLNAEFYSTEASGLLVGPAFGIGSELAATGSNGPSIFPSTALGIRYGQRLGSAGRLRAALFNARAGTLGDDHGLDLRFRRGLLAIAEGGLERGGSKVMVGAWRYGRQQPNIQAGAAPARAQGVYALAETGLGGGWSVFARGGLSDGRTGPFRGSWQAGLLARAILPGRPSSAFSVGLHGARLSAGQRRNLRDEGLAPARAETGLELTLADEIASGLTLQPTLQWIRHPGGERRAPAARVFGLRAAVGF